MLPSHKRGVRDFVVAALADAGKPIPIDRVVWVPQDAPPTARPYVTLQATGGTRGGPAPERRSTGGHGSATHSARTEGTSTVSITVVGEVDRTDLDQDADAYTTEILVRLMADELDGAVSPLDTANLAVQGVTEIPAIAALTGSSQWETRAALDVALTTAVVVTSTPGTVATVVITGTTDPPTPIGEIEATG